MPTSGCLLAIEIVSLMEEIRELLENWRNLANYNPVFVKDYFIDEVENRVCLTVSITVERVALFKTFMAICSINRNAIENAINRLDEKKDELI